MTHPTDEGGGGGLLGLGRGLPPNDFMAQHESSPSSEASCLKNVSSLNGFCFMTLRGGGRRRRRIRWWNDNNVPPPPFKAAPKSDWDRDLVVFAQWLNPFRGGRRSSCRSHTTTLGLAHFWHQERNKSFFPFEKLVFRASFGVQVCFEMGEMDPGGLFGRVLLHPTFRVFRIIRCSCGEGEKETVVFPTQIFPHSKILNDTKSH